MERLLDGLSASSGKVLRREHKRRQEAIEWLERVANGDESLAVGAAPGATDGRKRTALHYAAFAGKAEAVHAKLFQAALEAATALRV